LQETYNQSPTNFPFSNQLALVLVENKDPQKQKLAQEIAKINANLNPQNAEAASTLGWILYKQGFKTEAGQVLDNVIKSGALSADSAYYVAYALADQGRNKEAVQILENALDQPQPFANRTNAEQLRDKARKELQADASKDGKESTKATPSSNSTKRGAAPPRGKK
jgi:cytochrome c-type biogenesis protein CcmH/NrfG